MGIEQQAQRSGLEAVYEVVVGRLEQVARQPKGIKAKRPALGRAYATKLCDWFTVLGDDDFLTPLVPLDEFGELRLRFVKLYRRHSLV